MIGAVIIAIALALLFAGSRVETDGPDAQGYKWERRLPDAPAVAVHRSSDVYLNCAQEEKALSCARADRKAGTCDVYLPKNPAPWQEAHERRHCAGWIHP